MTTQTTAAPHIEMTETLVRFYVLLAQSLDRCLDESARQSFPEEELQAHLTTTRTKLLGLLSVNGVVRGKVEEEYDRVTALATTCQKGTGDQTTTLGLVKTERAVLQNKMIALSDLLAVFRAA